jgi:hypothetical protein
VEKKNNVEKQGKMKKVWTLWEIKKIQPRYQETSRNQAEKVAPEEENETTRLEVS